MKRFHALFVIIALLLLGSATVQAKKSYNYKHWFKLSDFALVFTYQKGCETIGMALKKTGGTFACKGGYFFPVASGPKIAPSQCFNLVKTAGKVIIPYSVKSHLPILVSNPATRTVRILKGNNVALAADYPQAMAGDSSVPYPAHRFWRVLVAIKDDRIVFIRRKMNFEQCCALVRRLDVGHNYIFFDGDEGDPRTYTPGHVVMVKMPPAVASK